MTCGNSSIELRVAVLPAFGARWLVPRLANFIPENPQAILKFSTRIAPFDFEIEDFDIEVHYGSSMWSGAVAHRLMAKEMVPVASPAYVRRFGIKKPADLNATTLLHQETRPTAWSEWFETVKVQAPYAFRGPLFDQFAMIPAAAIAIP